MPQVIHVVQCYSCRMYQVDIVKKAPKWTCKMCGEKQSLKTVFFRGSGKECRLQVQKLNELKGASALNNFTGDVSSPLFVDRHLSYEPAEIKAQTEWSDFVDENEDDTYDRIVKGSSIECIDPAWSNVRQDNTQEDRQRQFTEMSERNDNSSTGEDIVQAKRIHVKSNCHGEDDQVHVEVPVAKLRKIEANHTTDQSEWDQFLPDELSDQDYLLRGGLNVKLSMRFCK